MFEARSTPAIEVHPKVEALPALTSLRFFAAAYVVAFHYGPAYFQGRQLDVVRFGYSGVTFFFLLSGFILAYNYKDVDFSAPRVLTLFYRARIARLYPVFLLALAVHVPWYLGWVLKEPQPLRGLMASGALLAPLGLHAWVPGAACSLDCPSWSISVELFFYALFPVLLPLVLRDPVRVAFAALGLWGATVALATLLWQAYGGASLIAPEADGVGPSLAAQFIKYFPPLHLPEFVAGLLLYVAWRGRRVPGPALVGAAVLLGTLLVIVAPGLPEAAMHNGLTMLAWAPLILACAGPNGGLLCTRPMVFLGKISFALYLLHIPVFAMLNTVDRAVLHGWLLGHPWLGVAVASLASLAAAALAHLMVEEPMRRRIVQGGRRAAPRHASAA